MKKLEGFRLQYATKHVVETGMFSITNAAIERDIRADAEYETVQYQEENDEEPMPVKSDYHIPKSNPVKVIPAPPLVHEKESNKDDITSFTQKSR